MRNFKRARGFLTFAQNSSDVDYTRLAYGLALSLKLSQPEELSNLSIIVSPDDFVNEEYEKLFDEVIYLDEDLAEGESWKIQNEYQAYNLTPYKETIKLDCDMLFPSNISHWWDSLNKKDICSVHNPFTYRGEQIGESFYRKNSIENNIPTLYSAFTYFKHNEVSKEFFELIEDMTNNWIDYSLEHFTAEHRELDFTTDVAFGLAAKLMNLDTRPISKFIPSFVHMKTKIQNWPDNFNDEDWSKYVEFYLTPDFLIKIGNHRQALPLHYHNKLSLTDEHIEFMKDLYGRRAT